MAKLLTPPCVIDKIRSNPRMFIPDPEQKPFDRYEGRIMDFDLDDDSDSCRHESFPRPTIDRMDEIYHYNIKKYEGGFVEIWFVGRLIGSRGTERYIVVEYEIDNKEHHIDGCYWFSRSWEQIYRNWLKEYKSVIDEKISKIAPE